VRIRRLISVLLRAQLALLLAIYGVTAGVNARAQIAVVGDGGPGPVKVQHLTAELVALGPAIAPGGTQQVGLVLTMDKHWHVYWINPGDSGEPPKIAWKLPTGMSARAMQFPIPKRLPLGPLMDFGYEDKVAFPVTIAAASTMKPGPMHLDAQVSWLVCAQVCIPGNAHMGIDLRVQPGAKPGALVGVLGDALNLIPKPLPAGATFAVTGGTQWLTLRLIDGKRESNAEFFPYPTQAAANQAQPPDVIVNAAAQKIEPQRDGVRLTVQRSPDAATLPATLHGVIKLSDTEAYEVTAPVVPGEVVAMDGGSASSTTAMGAIGLAFVGGMLLNLMPCVFPVLFLKGLTLVQTAGANRAQNRRQLLRHGMFYTLGILLSFWGIVAALLVLRATGAHVGWGFQLQSPVFVALLASLIFLLALSLAGQFEIGLSLTSVGGELAQKQGHAGSFFTGVLATVVATPCAAPFMGAAIGFALTQSAGIVFAVFTALALGLAAPYLLLSWQPAWVRVLPRPGAWMEVFKHITAAIFFATAIWLAWVYGQLYAAGDGVNQVALLLSCFLLLAIAGWALGRWPAKWGSTIAAVVLIALGVAIPLSQGRGVGQAGTAVQTGMGQTNAAAKNGGELVWQPYSQQALDAARAAGHPVFIDFTAAWCLSCQVNERLVLKSADVENALLKDGVVTMKADWTNEDPEITAKLASLGRSSVPTYVLYPAASGNLPDVLPELLSKGVVLAAIERDAK
jgi:thiol:disulfide interchange protein DsbD